MATVQIAFTDNSDNETKFTVFRSVDGANVTGGAAEILAEIEWNGVDTWAYAKGVVDTGGSNDGDFIAGQAVDVAPSTVGQSFTISYTEANAGAYFYGVEAENAIGKSAVTETSAAITIA